MKRIDILLVSLLTVSILGVGYFIGVGTKQVNNAVGAFGDPFISLQLATDPDNGECLTTDGTNNSWSTSCGSGGSSFGKAWELTTNVFSQSSLAPTTTQNIAVSGVGTSTFVGGLESWRQIASPYFHATSTTATSTFSGDVIIEGIKHLFTHGIQATDSQGIHLHSNNGTEVAYFGAGGGTGITFPGYTDALLQTGVAGAVTEYAGTSCTNQFVRALSALGIATCASVSLSADVTGTLDATNGGTGQSTVTTGDLLYGSASNVWSKLAGVATGNALISGGVSTAPSWGKIGLTTHVSGTLPIANGGTNNSSAYTAGSVIFSNGTSLTQDNTNLFFNDSNNSLGIGTTTPQYPLTLFSSTASQLSLSSGSGKAQWTFRNINENLYISTTTIDGTATTSVPAFSIIESGFVGIGTSTPTSILHISGDADERVRLTNSPSLGTVGSGASGFEMGTLGFMNISRDAGTLGTFARMTSDGTVFAFRRDSTGVGSISVTTTATAYNTSSDRRFKENIVDTSLGLETLAKIKVRDFDFIRDGTHSQGFIAQELLPIYPYAVTTNGDDGVAPLPEQTEEENSSGGWQVDYGRLTPLIVKSIQELMSKDREIERRLEALEKELATLKRMCLL